MPTAREKMLAEWSNKPIIEPPGFFERLSNAAGTVAEDVAVGPLVGVLPESYKNRFVENVENYATGAVQGAQEVIRQGNALAESNPLALTGTPMEAGYTNAPAPPETNDQQFTRGMYKQATGQFNEGTVAPAFAGFSLLAPQLAAPYYAPIIASVLGENINKQGNEKSTAEKAGNIVAGTAKDLLMPAAYEFWNAEGADEYRKQNPGAFAADLTLYALSDAADLAVGGATARKATRNTPLSLLAPEAERNALATANKIIKEQGLETATPRDTRAIQGMLSENQSLPEVKLAIDEQNFKKGINEVIAGKYDNKQPIKVMETPLALNLIGAEVLPVEILTKNLRKILINKHGVNKEKIMTPEIVEQIPRSLTDPLMLMETYTGSKGEKRIVAVLDLKDKNGATIVVPFELKKINDKKGYEINEMLSAYSKTDKFTGEPAVKWFEDNVGNGNVKYINKTKTAKWLRSSGDEYPMLKRLLDSSLSYNIATERDFVKLKNNKPENYLLNDNNTGLIWERSGKSRREGNIKPITVKEVEKAFNDIVPVRYGGVDAKYKGLFKVAPEIVRTRAFKEYSTYSHELGHYLDKQFNIAGHDAELIRGAEDMWGNNPVFREYTSAEKRAEGIAEFTAELLRDPLLAQRNFPGYYRDFKSALQLPENKPLGRKLDKLADALFRYTNQSKQAAARASISFADDIKLKTRKENLTEIANRAYQLAFDDKDPLKRFVDEVVERTKESVDYKDNPYLLSRSATSSAEARSTMLLDDKGDPLEIVNTLNQVYNNSLKYAVTLQDILKDVNAVKIPKEVLAANGYKDNRQAFSVYLTARRQLEIQSQKPDYAGPMSKEVAQAVVNEAPAEFVKAAEKVYQHFDNVLSILEDSGLVSNEMHKTLSEKYKNYVPMYRDMELADATQGRVRKSNFANIANPVKSLNDKGGRWNVIDPIDSLIVYTQRSIDAAEKNKVAQALVKMKDVEGIGRYLEERPDLEGKSDVDNNVFTVWQNGEKKSYQAAPELYDAMTNMNRKTFAAWQKALMAPADIMRAGATGTPAFGLFNFARDTFTAGLYSRNITVPLLEPLANSFIGAYKIVADKKLYNEFKAAGVPMTTRIKAERASLKWQQLRETPIIKQAAIIYDAFTRLNAVLEEAPRMGEFAAARRKGKSIEEAGFDAREVTMDFGRGGDVSRQINRIIPFFNVTLQSADRLLRELKQNPVRLTARIGSYLLIPAAIEWLMFNGEDWYEDMPNDLKDNYLFMRFGDDLVKVPIPQELAFLIGGVKRSLSAMYNNDPDAMNEWAENTLNTFLPDFIPAFLKPFIEWETQYNFFTEQNVVPKNLQNLPDKEQYNIYTSMAAIKIGAALNLSPVQVDNLIRNIGATTATTLNAAIGDTMLGRDNELPAKNLNEAPVIGRFGYTPGKRSQNIDDFYKLYEETSKDVNAYDKEAANYKNWKGLQNSMKKVRKLNKKRQAVLNDKQLTAREKRTQMDELQRQIIEVAKIANEKYRKPEE